MMWTEGVFLATHPAKPKPSSIALLKGVATGNWEASK
jgi:hypothetical protein